ncbi:MAG: hypothetical protein ABI609_17965 [Acidobacteriota bacterium]
MRDHAGHTPGMPEKPATASEKKPTKPPATPDPHAGHDMGKPGIPPKGAEKK